MCPSPVADDFEEKEYFELVKAVNDNDQRLFTVKGWGVTLSLVALGLGFQYRAYGFFLIAAASSFAFWIIEGAVKRHQMRYYPRMREIEVNRYVADGRSATSSPRMDFSWERAGDLLRGKATPNADITPPYLHPRVQFVVVTSSYCVAPRHHVGNWHGPLSSRLLQPLGRFLAWCGEVSGRNALRSGSPVIAASRAA